MHHPVEIRFVPTADAPELKSASGRIVLLVGEQARPPAGLPQATRQAVTRALGSDAWRKVKPGSGIELAWPAGLVLDTADRLRLSTRCGRSASCAPIA